MRRITALLVATSLALAASTAYFAYQLHGTRQELAAARMTPASSHAARADTGRIPAPAPDFPPATTVPAGGTEPVQQPGPGKKEMDATARAGQFQANAHMRKVLADPERRARMERDIRKNLEREVSQFGPLLDLTDDEQQRLVDLMTGHQMSFAEATAKCADTPGCDVSATASAQYQVQQRELADFMGDEKAPRFMDYRDNFMERNSVESFRAELPERMQLSDLQAERLAIALGDERRRIIKEWKQRGAGSAAMGNTLGYLYYPNNTRDIEERVNEAGEYQRRQRERAAELLTAQQLEVFTQQQKDLLDVARSGWESEAQTAENR
jgi:hypothetical protein